jgi:hypothetical protein
MVRAAVLLPTVFAALGMAGAWRSEGQLPPGFGFAQYVGKFCFDYAPLVKTGNASKEVQAWEDRDDGVVSIDVQGHLQPAVDDKSDLYFMVFDDEDEHWPRVRSNWNKLSCKLIKDSANTVIPLSSPLKHSQFQHRIGIHEHVRPRFWYFAFVNCGQELSGSVSYQLHAWNPIQGYQAEFGIDRRNSLQLDIVFTALFGAVVASLVAFYNLPCEWRARPLLAALQASAACSTLSCSCLKLHSLVYAKDGHGLAGAEVLGIVFACVAKALLTLLMFLLARGWSLLTAEADSSQRTLITVAFVGIVVVSVGCEIHGQFFHDQSTSLYLYESWPGVVILALNLGLLGAAARLLWETYVREASKEVRAFYRLMALANMLYFAALPTICVLAHVWDPWVRRKFVERTELGARFAATAMLLFCLWPTLMEARMPTRDGAEPMDFNNKREWGRILSSRGAAAEPLDLEGEGTASAEEECNE